MYNYDGLLEAIKEEDPKEVRFPVTAVVSSIIAVVIDIVVDGNKYVVQLELSTIIQLYITVYSTLLTS